MSRAAYRKHCSPTTNNGRTVVVVDSRRKNNRSSVSTFPRRTPKPHRGFNTSLRAPLAFPPPPPSLPRCDSSPCFRLWSLQSRDPQSSTHPTTPGTRTNARVSCQSSVQLGRSVLGCIEQFDSQSRVVRQPLNSMEPHWYSILVCEQALATTTRQVSALRPVTARTTQPNIVPVAEDKNPCERCNRLLTGTCRLLCTSKLPTMRISVSALVFSALLAGSVIAAPLPTADFENNNSDLRKRDDPLAGDGDVPCELWPSDLCIGFDQ